jgi:hypothetical protein
MPPVFTTLVEVLDSSGVVVLSTAGTQTTSGYEHITWTRPGRPKRRLVEQSAYVDGEVETASVLDATRLLWHVRVVGTSYADLDAKYDALVAAAESGPGMAFRITIAGVARLWKCTGDPNITPRESDTRDNDARRWSFREEVIVDWPVTPN